MDTFAKRQLAIWVTVPAIPILLTIFWITKDISIIVMLVISILIYLGWLWLPKVSTFKTSSPIYSGWIWLPKVLMFVIYHLIIGTLIFFFVNEYWLPLFSNAWDWLNNSIKAITYTGLAGFSVWSIFSCFDDKTLKETDLGHWSISGWLPKHPWAANLKNGPPGVFTGLPASMVSIKKISGEKKSIKKDYVIQVEIDDDLLNRKFAVVFGTSFNEQVVDTLKTLTTPSSTSDLEKIFEKSLTDWLNDPKHKYKDVKGIKAEIVKIQKRVEASLDDAEKIYGKKMSDARVIDIQLPEDIINQQIEEAKEITDLEGFIEQSKKLWAQFPDMKDKEIADLILTLRGINKKVTFNTSGNTGGGKKGRTSSGGGATPVVII